MKKLLLLSLALLFCATLSAQKFPATLKMTDGMQQKGEVDFPKIDDKEVKFYPADGSKAAKLASADIALMTITFESGTTEEYEFVPIIAPMAVYKKTGKVSATIWLMVELRGYMTLYHNRTEATTRTISSKGNTMNPGHTDKYCRRPGEPGASMVLSTFSAGTNGFFKRLALVYFDDDQQIIDKIKSGKYTYKDLVEIIQEYNSCHGN